MTSIVGAHLLSDYAMPAWHPQKPIIACITHQVLHLHHVQLGQAQRMAKVPSSGPASIESWSPCGLLLCTCFSHDRTPSEMMPGSLNSGTMVLKTDGSGTVFRLLDSKVVHSVLSCASLGLVCMWHLDDLSVYDLFSGL